MKERNYGIDLLRIISMFMVLVLHILGQGGILLATTAGSINWKVAWFLETAAYCAVNCYALISGFVGINAKYKFSNTIYLWLQVVFYTLGITFLYSYILPDPIDTKMYINALFPVITKQYWYFTAYFCLSLFIPIINQGIHTMNKKQLKFIIIALIFIYSIWDTSWQTNVLGLGGGYSCIWLLILYIIGAYIGKYNPLKKISSRLCFLGYLIMIIITWLGTTNNIKILSYTSPTILGASLFLLLMVRKLNIPETGKKIIKFIAPLTFSVYLIHVNYFPWNYFMKGKFVSLEEFTPVKLIFAVLLNALIIFVICILIDSIRDFIFRKLKIKQYLEKLEKKLLK